MTARDLLTASLRTIGAVAPGESIEASEAEDALAALNMLLGTWSTEELIVYQRVRETLTLTPSDGSYTMGVGGDLNTSRPQRIDEALLRDESSSPALEYPIDILSLAEWTAIPAKDVNGLTAKLYADEGYPLTTISLYPRPSAAYKLVLWSQKPITSIDSLDDDIEFPPGYERALKFNLAIDLAPEYGKKVAPEVAASANESKGAIKRLNLRPQYLEVDPALLRRGSYNIYTGGS